MKVTYGPKADAIYIQLAAGAVAETNEVLPAVFADDDATGKVLGVAWLVRFHASGQATRACAGNGGLKISSHARFVRPATTLKSACLSESRGVRLPRWPQAISFLAKTMLHWG